jgi:hypothetical protein
MIITEAGLCSDGPGQLADLLLGLFAAGNISSVPTIYFSSSAIFSREKNMEGDLIPRSCAAGQTHNVPAQYPFQNAS